MLVVGCKKEKDEAEIPQVKTEKVTEIAISSATGGGTIISDGGAEIISKGVVWSKNSDPTVEQNNGITDEGGGTDVFQSKLNSLESNSIYYLRAYAKNEKGVGYGSQFNFTTLEAKSPEAAFKSDITTGDAPLSVKFTDLSTEDPKQWFWEFGDGATSNTQNPSHTYQSAGSFDVKLTATNPYGSNQTVENDYIIVKPVGIAPIAEFSASPISGMNPLTVNFVDLSSNSPLSWSWDFGDGSTSNVKNPAHTYTQIGTFGVILSVTNEFGTSSETKHNLIQVNATGIAPVAEFTAAPRNGTSPLIVSFIDQSSNNPTSWRWTFGDGQSSTERNPSHTYNNVGEYTVSLEVKNEFGENIIIKDNFIVVNTSAEIPIAEFTASPRSGTSPLNVSFVDQSLNNPTSWKWTFGDGESCTERNPVHVFQNVGTYAVSLEVSNSVGNNTIIKDNYIVINNSGVAPIGEFTASPRQGVAPLTVNFIDQSSNNPTSWKWFFGNGASNTERNPSYTYETPGNYTVKLEVKNEFGEDVVIKSNFITVSPGGAAPVANFSGTPRSGNSPLVVTFSDLSNNSPTSWLWNFGDGSTSQLKNPSHTYQQPGNYTVSLTASNSFGNDVMTRQNYIVVNQVQYEWLHYDNGINNGALGLTNGGNYDVAIRLAPYQLQEYNGWSILSVKFFPKDYNSNYAIEGFIGSNPNTNSPVFYKEVNNPVINAWNEVSLNQPYTINANTDLWIGYFIYNSPANSYPAGYDIGPAVPGYSDLINTGQEWQSINGLGYDHNWNIQFRISNAKGESKVVTIDNDKKPPTNKNQSKSVSSKK